MIVSGPHAPLDSLPASVDLSRFSPPVGSQGPLASCVSWVTGYYLRGWFAERDGYYPTGGPDGEGGFAPMYLFNQITHGQDKGTTFSANLDMLVAQGIDSRADYTQGDTNYADAPTTAEQDNAANYKISGYTILFTGAGQGPSACQAIEASLASGNPVSIGLPVYDSFWNADASHYFVDVPGHRSAYHGNHAVFASKYDANGLWVENQWGTGWGLNGWAELSWDFVNRYVWEAVTLRPAAPPNTAVTTATATPSAPASSSTPDVAATSTEAPASQTPTPQTPASQTPAAPTATPPASATAVPGVSEPGATPTASPPKTNRPRIHHKVRAARRHSSKARAHHQSRAAAWWRRWLRLRWYAYHVHPSIGVDGSTRHRHQSQHGPGPSGASSSGAPAKRYSSAW